MKIIKTLILHNARALLDCRRREHGPPVKNYGIPFVVHVHAIANGRFHRGNSAATRSDRQFSGSERWRGITVLRLPSADRTEWQGATGSRPWLGSLVCYVLVERRVTPISVLFGILGRPLISYDRTEVHAVGHTAFTVIAVRRRPDTRKARETVSDHHSTSVPHTKSQTPAAGTVLVTPLSYVLFRFFFFTTDRFPVLCFVTFSHAHFVRNTMITYYYRYTSRQTGQTTCTLFIFLRNGIMHIKWCHESRLG